MEVIFLDFICSSKRENTIFFTAEFSTNLLTPFFFVFLIKRKDKNKKQEEKNAMGQNEDVETKLKN